MTSVCVRTKWPTAGFAFLLALALCAPLLVYGQARADEKDELADKLDYLQVMERVTLDEVKKVEQGLAADTLSPRRTGVARDAKVSSAWMSAALTQAVDAHKKALRTTDRSMREYWLKEARSKANTAERLVKGLLGPGAEYRRPSAEFQERIEQSRESGRELHETAKQMNRYTMLTELEKFAGSKGSKKPDMVLLDTMTAKQERLEKVLRRQDESLNKANAARSVWEKEFWLDAAKKDQMTVQRLAMEITLGVVKDVAKAKHLPEVAEALRSNDPKRREEAMALVESLVELGWEREIIPVLTEVLQEAPPAEEQPKAELEPIPGFSSGILAQTEIVDEYLQEAVVDSDPKVIRRENQAEWGEGRAGAGGISLFKAAVMPKTLSVGKIRGVGFEGERMSLLYGEKRILLPRLDPDHLALSIRAIYGEEGVIKGKLTADEPDAVAIKTGREKYGEVVWKKDFLPHPWKATPLGTTVGLGLGPGIGLLSLPEPSTDRVTYYGPIKDTRMGRVLFDADLLLGFFLTGVNLKTGLPEPPPDVEGFMSRLERTARMKLSSPGEEAPARERKESATSAPVGEQPWWAGSVWFVWVPDRFILRFAEDGTSLEFTETRMKLAAWSAGEENLKADATELCQHATRHYEDLARTYPVLKDLVEVAKAVSVVRWLKQEDIPLDLSWARSWRVEKVETPATIRMYLVLLAYDSSGKPVIVREGEK